MKYIKSIYYENKDGNEEKYKDKKMSLFFILASIMAIIIVVYVIYIEILLIDDTEKYIKTTLNKEVDIIYNSILTTKEVVKSISNIDIINKSEILNSEKIKLLEEESKRSGFKRMGIANLEGDVVTTDNREFSIKDRWYFNEIISGKEFVYEKAVDKIDGTDIFIISVPIIDDGNIIGLLFVTQNINTMTSLVDLEYYKGQIEKYVIEYDGNILLKNNDLVLDESRNLFEMIYKENRTDKSERFISEVHNKEEKISEIEYNGEKRYVGHRYIPNSKNLYAIISIPKSLILVNVKRLLLGNIILISIVIFAFYFIFRSMIKSKELYRELENSNKEGMISLRNVSHEIRTPISLIIGIVSLCEKYINDEELAKKYFNKIKVLSSHLLNLVNDILDISKIEAGKIKVNKEVIKVEEFIDSINIFIEEISMNKGKKYVVETNNIEDLYIIGDDLKLRQVLLNLLANAVKFTTENGEVLFKISAINIKNTKRIKIKFEIIDNGIGMTDEFMRMMFTPFNQANDFHSNKLEGSGLGLVISKELIEVMGSSLIVKSKMEIGSEFEFCIEFDKYEALSHSRDRQTQEKKSKIYYGKNILLVEDNEIHSIIANEILNDLGINVDFAKNGQEAIEKFNKSEINYYDLIFMDIQMPIMNGYEATEKIRLGKREDSKKVKIVAMTAHSFNEEWDECISVGMNYHIVKPINREVINEVFEKNLMNSKVY